MHRRPATLPTVIRNDLSLPLVVAVALVARLVVALVWVFGQGLGLGDLPYYADRSANLSGVGPSGVLREYPTPTAWVLSWPHAFGPVEEATYAFWFITGIVVAEIGFCVLIWRSGSAYRGWAIAAWSVFLAMTGPLVWLRFDLLPAVLVGAAALLVVRRPAVAGSLLALGAGLKLWPALLLPALLGRLRRTPRTTWLLPFAGFTITGVVIVIASLAAGGWDRLVSPLTWQADRGLQIESVPASPLMFLRAWDLGGWNVNMSHYQAFEIFGSGVTTLLMVANLSAIIGVLIGIGLAAWQLTRTSADPSGTAGIALMVAIIGLLIITNKTLSPQYIVWLAGPIVVLVARQGLGDRLAQRWLLGLLLIAALSHVVYPVLYGHLNGMDDDVFWTPVVTLVLTVRNLALMALTVDAIRAAWRTVGRSAEPA